MSRVSTFREAIHQVDECLSVIRSYSSSYFPHENQPDLKDEGQVATEGESDGSDSERTSGREPEVTRAGRKLCGKQSYRKRETYLI